MPQTVILYQSKYGATKRYAQWLGEELGCDVVETKTASLNQIRQYDRIVLGGGLYASGIAGISFLRRNYGSLKDKKIVLFAVGASPYDEKAMLALKAHNLREELAGIPLFYCRGAWNESAMSWKDRTLCRMLKDMVAKKDPVAYEPWETALVQASGSNEDWTDRAALQPILDYLRG